MKVYSKSLVNKVSPCRREAADSAIRLKEVISRILCLDVGRFVLDGLLLWQIVGFLHIR